MTWSPLGQNLFRIGTMDQATHLPDLTWNTHVVMVSVLSKVAHDLLTPDWQMACLSQAHLQSILQNQKKILSPQVRHPVPPSMRPLVLPQLCHPHPYQVSHCSTRPLYCAPLILRPPRASPLKTTSPPRQVLKLSWCLTTSQHLSVTVSRPHCTKLWRYVLRSVNRSV
jgi:hypothetical protein